MANLENSKLRPPISDKSMLYIHKIVLIWLILALFIFFIGHYFNVNQQACGVCYFLSIKLWFVEDMAIASRFTEGTRLQWLFLVLSCPIIIMYLLCKINDVKHGDMKVQMPLLMGPLAALSIVAILIEKDKSAAHGYYGLFLNSMSIASIMSFGIFYMLMLGVVIVGLYIKAYIRH